MAKQSRGAKGAGSVFKSGKYWIAQVMDGYRPDGKPRYRQVQRKKEADAVAALNELKGKISLGVSIPDGRSKSVAAWMEEWLEEHVKPNAAPKTYDFYKLHFEKRLKTTIGGTDLRRLKPADVTRLFRKLEADGCSKSTIDATRRTLRAAYSVALKSGLCGENPVAKATAPKVTRSERVHFDAAQAQALLTAIKGTAIENVVRFTLATGVRVGEATGLTWANVDLAGKQCLISQQLQRVDKRLVLRPLKTDKSRRAMPLVGHSLVAVTDEQARQAVEEWDNPLDLVFLNPWGRPLDPKFIDKLLKDALERAELPKCGMHALRHTAATFMLMAGLNLHQVSRYLGHSQIALTSNLYGHVLDGAMREAAEALQKAYDAAGQAEAPQRAS